MLCNLMRASTCISIRCTGYEEQDRQDQQIYLDADGCAQAATVIAGPRNEELRNQGYQEPSLPSSFAFAFHTIIHRRAVICMVNQ